MCTWRELGLVASTGGRILHRNGHIQDELQQQVHDPDETDDLLRLGLHRLPITQFPRLRSLATVLASYDGAAELDEGLAIVIAGLRSQLLN